MDGPLQLVILQVAEWGNKCHLFGMTRRRESVKSYCRFYYHRTFIQLMTGDITDLPYTDIDSQRSCSELVRAIKYHKRLGDRCGYRENERILMNRAGIS